MSWIDAIVSRAHLRSGAHRFAGIVSGRHRGDLSAWSRCAPRGPAVPRVALRSGRVVASPAHTSITFAPRIELRLASPERRVVDVAGTATRIAPVERTVVRTVSAASAEPLLARAAARGVRDDGPSASPSERAARQLARRATPNAAEASVRGGVASPQRVLLRRTPVVVESPAPTRDERPARVSPSPRATPLSPVEIDRLTDHIVHTIDRRIAAFRERQGRV